MGVNTPVVPMDRDTRRAALKAALAPYQEKPHVYVVTDMLVSVLTEIMGAAGAASAEQRREVCEGLSAFFGVLGSSGFVAGVRADRQAEPANVVPGTDSVN